MKKVLSATIGLLAISAVPAAAADLPVKARPMVPVVTAYNWTGCYIGGNVGGKWARVRDDVFVPATIGSPDRLASFASDTAGTFIGGGQVGWGEDAPSDVLVDGVSVSLLSNAGLLEAVDAGFAFTSDTGGTVWVRFTSGPHIVEIFPQGS